MLQEILNNRDWIQHLSMHLIKNTIKNIFVFIEAKHVLCIFILIQENQKVIFKIAMKKLERKKKYPLKGLHKLSIVSSLFKTSQIKQ